MLGNKPQYTTKNPESGVSFDLGSSKSSHKGFQDGELPDADKLWKEYYTHVMRGDQDFDGTTVAANRTFSAMGQDGQKPPVITAYKIGSTKVGDEGAGSPDGGFVPTTASPSDGSTNASAIPALNGAVVTRLGTTGAGSQDNGLLLSPLKGSKCQMGQGWNPSAPEHPTYSMVGTNLTLGGWSDT